MDNYKLIVTFTPDGKRSFEIQGLSGTGCTALLEFVNKMGEVIADEHTAEYYHEPEAEQGVTGTVTARG